MTAPAPPPELHEVYDASTVAALDARAQPAQVLTRGPRPSWRRTLAGGAVVTGLALGMRQVLDPDPPGEAMIEIDRDPGIDTSRRVTLYFVPGDPQGTVAVVRPWLG